MHWIEECHKTTCRSQIGSKHADMFAEEDHLLIKLKSVIDQSLTDICNHHEKYYLLKYFSIVTHFWCIKAMQMQEIVLLSVANISLCQLVIFYIWSLSLSFLC